MRLHLKYGVSLKKKSIKNQSKNIIMKNSVLILGIALVLFSNNSNAKSRVKLPCNLFQNIISSDDASANENDSTAKFEKPSLSEDAIVFNPETVIANNTICSYIISRITQQRKISIVIK